MRRPHYAWVVCLGGALVLCSTIGLGVNVFTIYQPEIIRLNGFTNAQGSWITTIRSFTILAALLTVNQLCARLGLRKTMTLGTGLVAASCVCFALAPSFFWYGCAAALAGLGYCYGGMVPLSLVISAWFQNRRNLALGLASAGSGISTVFAPAIITWLIHKQGLRAAFLWEAAVILLTALLAWLLIRNAPSELGLEPYQCGETADFQPKTSSASVTMTPALTALLLATALLVGAPGGPGFSHLTVLYAQEGYDSTLLALLMSYTGFAVFVGKIICGQVYDRMGSRWGNCYTLSATLVAFLLCCLAPLQNAWLPFLAATFIGLGLPISAVFPAIWAADLYHPHQYAKAVRANTVAYTLGVLLFGPVPGILADHFQSYVPAYGLFALLSILSLLFITFLYRRTGAGSRPQPTAPPIGSSPTEPPPRQLPR